MSAHVTLATAWRVLAQLRRDRRTLALILVVPPALVALLLPLTYAYEALAKVAADDIDGRLWVDVTVICGCIVLALVLAAATLPRRTA